MGVFLGRSLFSGTLLFFFLGLIFCIVGYLSNWLVPRHGLRPSVLSVGVRQACFEEYETLKRVADIVTINGCHDTTKTSQVFSEVEPKYVSPGEIKDQASTSLV